MTLRRLGGALACLGALSLGSGAAAQCRQALALALDVSGSVDAREYRLQLDGLAAALDSGSVRQALLASPASPVHLLVFEWSGPEDQALILPWTPVTSEAGLDLITAKLRATERRAASPGTALGQAMMVGADLLATRPDCWARTLDISGDGKSNLGTRPRDMKRRLAGRGITINALVIGADAPSQGDTRQADIAELSSYFRADVIMGEDAFVETALGFENYAQAMARKLERELRPMILSRVD